MHGFHWLKSGYTQFSLDSIATVCNSVSYLRVGWPSQGDGGHGARGADSEMG